MDKKGSHIDDKQKCKRAKRVGGSSCDIPKPTDGLHKTFVVREEDDEADSGKDKMSVWIGCGIQEERYMLVVCRRQTITKNIDIMTLGQGQFSSVTLHVGNHWEKEGRYNKRSRIPAVAITLSCSCILALAAHRDLHPCSLVPTLTAQDDLLLFCSTG